MTDETVRKDKGNIMIVDDTLPNLRVLAKMLIHYGYLVRGLPNGEAALKAALSEPPDLILLDITMPGMDGYEVCRRLKRYDETRDIPVIFISALSDILDKVKAFAIGGVDYITKPFQVEEVLARVDTHMTIQRLREQLEVQVQSLQEANNALEESNNELDAFSHTVAHDLKNPLANITMGVELLRLIVGDEGDERLLEVASDLRTSVSKTVNIIDELLLLASVRKEDVQYYPLDMPHIIQQATQRLDWMIKNGEATLSCPKQWPEAIGYGPWVEEIWVNYISNAIKYGGSPPKLILGATEQKDGRVSFWIADNGPGIPEEKIPKLFAEFSRLEQTRIQGHGLGLSVVKRIATKLGGDVDVTSQMGKGSVFSFTLPAVES